MKKWAKYARIAFVIIKFLQKLEKDLDPEEKTEIDDIVLEVLASVAKSLSKK